MQANHGGVKGKLPGNLIGGEVDVNQNEAGGQKEAGEEDEEEEDEDREREEELNQSDDEDSAVRLSQKIYVVKTNLEKN